MLFLILQRGRVLRSSSRCCRVSVALECIANKVFAKYWKTIVVAANTSMFVASSGVKSTARPDLLRLIGYQLWFYVSLLSRMLIQLHYFNIWIRFILYANKLFIYFYLSIYLCIDLYIYIYLPRLHRISLMSKLFDGGKRTFTNRLRIQRRLLNKY